MLLDAGGGQASVPLAQARKAGIREEGVDAAVDVIAAVYAGVLQSLNHRSKREISNKKFVVGCTWTTSRSYTDGVNLMGQFISDERLIRIGHQLLCVLLAAYDFPNLYRGDGDPDPLDDLRSFEDSDLSEQLVMLAALARANDDEHQTLSAVKKVLPDGVGIIEQNGTTIVLTPREACNKIIHAKEISFEPDWSEEHPIWHRFYKRQKAEVKGRYKNPRITIIGTAQNGQGWKAEINAINFLLGVSTDYSKWSLA